MATAELAPGTWTEVPIRESVQMCGTTANVERPATFLLELDGEPHEVDGTHVETLVDTTCD